MVEMCATTHQNEGCQTLNLRDSKVSLYESKITTKEKTTEQKSDHSSNKSKKQSSDHPTDKSNLIAAARQNKVLKELEVPKGIMFTKRKVNCPSCRKKATIRTSKLKYWRR